MTRTAASLATGPFGHDWPSVAVKHLAVFQSGSAIDGEEIEDFGTYPVYGGNGLRGYTERFTHKGEFVLVGRQGALCGNINYAEGHFWASEHALVGHPRRMFDRQWFGEVLRTANLGQFSTAAAQPGIAAEVVNNLRIPVPSVETQRLIARFLDRETGRIDGLIEKKARFIALLKEKEKAAISRLVRRGLDRNAPTIDSGVDWRGRGPAHWVRGRMKDHFRQEKRQGYEDLTVLSVYREFGVIEKSSRDDNINKTPENLSKYQLVNPNDLVINKMKAWQGSMGIAPMRGITSPDYVVMRPIGEHDPRYMHHYLRAQPMPWVYRLISNGIRTDQWRMEPEKFLGLPVYMPPIEEQRLIAERIDVELERIRGLISLTESSIDLLREKRAALITSAVTGKIDVRAAA